MTTLATMYPPQALSPATTTSGAVTTSSTTVSVLNGSVLPDAPNLLTFGGETENPETVLMTAKNGNTLTIQRGVQGSARAWPAGSTIARLFTAKDLLDLQSNITALLNDKAEAGDVPTPSTSTPAKDGTGSAGSGTTYARGNHVHPTDDTRQAKITASGLLKGDGNGGVAAAVAGTDYALPSAIPSAYTFTPNMDGTGSAGTSTAYARGNHTHPTDTSRQAKITASGLLKGDGSGGVTAAAAGTDYQTPLVAGTDYATPAALANYIPTAQKGANNGVAELDAHGHIFGPQSSPDVKEIADSTYTVSAGDEGYLLRTTATGGVTLTIPSTITRVGTTFWVNAGVSTTITPGDNVYIQAGSSPAVFPQHSLVLCKLTRVGGSTGNPRWCFYGMTPWTNPAT